MPSYENSLIQRSKIILQEDYCKKFYDRVKEHSGIPNMLTLDKVLLDLAGILKNRQLTVEEFSAYKDNASISKSEFDDVLDDINDFINNKTQNKLKRLLQALKEYETDCEINV